MPATLTGWKTVKNPVTNNDGWITKPSYDFGGTTGTVNYDPGVPFGTYTVCADAVTGTTNVRRRKAYSSAVTVNNAAGTSAADIVISTSTFTTASCP
jgi:hypothetical protein